jgi:hypothetical protein
MGRRTDAHHGRRATGVAARRAGQRSLCSRDQGDNIADALDRLHAGGWNVGDTAFFVEGGGLVHVVTGSDGENMIRAKGATCSEA